MAVVTRSVAWEVRARPAAAVGPGANGAGRVCENLSETRTEVGRISLPGPREGLERNRRDREPRVALLVR
jgi:hypothetical protein